LDFQRDDAPLRELGAQGVLIQVNADSLLRTADGRTQRFARRLVTEGLVHAIASDGHRGSSWRPVTTLAEGVEAAAALVGPERAQWMAAAAPAAIVEGADLPVAPYGIPQRKSRRLFGR
jgi:tyrosine-protein phosphatase YwqE